MIGVQVTLRKEGRVVMVTEGEVFTVRSHTDRADKATSSVAPRGPGRSGLAVRAAVKTPLALRGRKVGRKDMGIHRKCSVISLRFLLELLNQEGNSAALREWDRILILARGGDHLDGCHLLIAADNVGLAILKTLVLGVGDIISHLRFSSMDMVSMGRGRR